jgi:hypothetical protein
MYSIWYLLFPIFRFETSTVFHLVCVCVCVCVCEWFFFICIFRVLVAEFSHSCTKWSTWVDAGAVMTPVCFYAPLVLAADMIFRNWIPVIGWRLLCIRVCPIISDFFVNFLFTVVFGWEDDGLKGWTHLFCFRADWNQEECCLLTLKRRWWSRM